MHIKRKVREMILIFNGLHGGLSADLLSIHHIQLSFAKENRKRPTCMDYEYNLGIYMAYDMVRTNFYALCNLINCLCAIAFFH